MGVVDRLATDFRAKASVERNPCFTAVQRVYPAADPRAPFEHHDIPSCVPQTECRGQTSQAGTDDDDTSRGAWIGSRRRPHNRLAGRRTTSGRDGHRRTREESPT